MAFLILNRMAAGKSSIAWGPAGGFQAGEMRERFFEEVLKVFLLCKSEAVPTLRLGFDEQLSPRILPRTSPVYAAFTPIFVKNRPVLPLRPPISA
jgi:hypothetical protein